MPEEKIKKIISLYTKVPADQIGHQTIIDRTALSSSILLHRMYADIAKEGFEAAGYLDIKDYGMLLKKLGIENGTGPDNPAYIQALAPFIPKNSLAADTNPVGIDIEEIISMPVVNDFREDNFYTMNYSNSEVSYCILQPSPLASFAGLFAAKEAIVKANPLFKNLPFNTIVIDHLPGGKPIHPDFYLSISHTANLAIAVAIQKNAFVHAPSATGSVLNTPTKNSPLLYFISFSAIILAVIAFIIVILRR